MNNLPENYKRVQHGTEVAKGDKVLAWKAGRVIKESTFESWLYDLHGNSNGVLVSDDEGYTANVDFIAMEVEQ
jgi:hypothetical protein